MAGQLAIGGVIAEDGGSPEWIGHAGQMMPGVIAVDNGAAVRIRRASQVAAAVAMVVTLPMRSVIVSRR